MKIAEKLFGVAPFLVGSALLLPSAVFAQTWLPEGPGAASDLDGLIRIGLNTAIVLAAVVAVVYLVYNGFRYMIAAGDATATEAAQKGIANAVIGLVIVIVAGLIVNFVLDKLGVKVGDIDSSSLRILVGA